MEKTDISNWLDANGKRFTDLADQIWATPETNFTEFKSSKAQAKFLEDDGFDIEWNIGGLNTAFIATWKKGSGPTIGFVGEYDALPGLSQKIQPSPEPIEEGANGHGCGHNLLGTGAVAAAVATKEWFSENNQTGEIRYYGCPAEEGGFGKVYMVREGAFDDLDVAFNFHPGWSNYAVRGTFLGAVNLFFRFKGKTSHAGTAPHLGRSALDAVELMNVGVNYLREHMEDHARIYYVITNGGVAPNIVPDKAEVHYSIKGLYPDDVAELLQRVRNVAKGAALMTDTEVEDVIDSSAACMMNNRVLADLQANIMEEIGDISFTEYDINFAAEINSHFPPKNSEMQKRIINWPESQNFPPLVGKIFRDIDVGEIHHASTDMGDVSWKVPVCMIRTTCWPSAVSPHSWGVVASGGMEIGHKGMMFAAKVMACTACELFTDPDKLAEIRQEFENEVATKPYEPMLPQDKEPPTVADPNPLS